MLVIYIANKYNDFIISHISKSKVENKYIKCIYLGLFDNSIKDSNKETYKFNHLQLRIRRNQEPQLSRLFNYEETSYGGPDRRGLAAE